LNFEIEDIFTPSTGVDLVFNMNSLNSVSRSSIIYDTDFQNQHIIVAQPLVPFTKTIHQLHVTTIVSNQPSRIRVGIACRPEEFLDQYLLANQTKAKAVLLKYEIPIKEINIRSAFRLPLSHRHLIKAKILYKDTEYYTAKDFIIRDISLTGAGLVIPKIKGGKDNTLGRLKRNDIIPLGIILVDIEKEKPVGIFPLKAKIVRINKNYSPSHILAGLKITNMNQKNETLLNKFIHNAQVEELRRLNTRNK